MHKFSNLLYLSAQIQQPADSLRSNSATHYMEALNFGDPQILSAEIRRPADSVRSKSATRYICAQDPWHPCQWNDPHVLCAQNQRPVIF